MQNIATSPSVKLPVVGVQENGRTTSWTEELLDDGVVHESYSSYGCLRSCAHTDRGNEPVAVAALSTCNLAEHAVHSHHSTFKSTTAEVLPTPASVAETDIDVVPFRGGDGQEITALPPAANGTTFVPIPSIPPVRPNLPPVNAVP